MPHHGTGHGLVEYAGVSIDLRHLTIVVPIDDLPLISQLRRVCVKRHMQHKSTKQKTVSPRGKDQMDSEGTMQWCSKHNGTYGARRTVERLVYASVTHLKIVLRQSSPFSAVRQ